MPASLRVPLQIRGVETRNRVFLAPMSGISDLPFREMAWKFDAGLVFSEMVASEGLSQGEAEMQLKVAVGSFPLHVVQLAGCETHWMAEAAKIAEASGASIIDINMGCPAKRVTRGYAGSALMRDPDHAVRLIEAVMAATRLPVTLKMRLGWDHDNLNAPELARRAEACGISMITVHGRTRCQFYKGHADWAAVRNVAEAINVPLVVNGDIESKNDALQALEQSRANAVMIGRAAVGKPWLAGQLADLISDECAEDLMLDHRIPMMHFSMARDHYGDGLGIRQFRKHLAGYLDNLALDSPKVGLRKQALTSQCYAEITELIAAIYENGAIAGSALARKAA